MSDANSMTIEKTVPTLLVALSRRKEIIRIRISLSRQKIDLVVIGSNAVNLILQK